MNQLAQRRDRYLELTNHILPQLAHQRQFPVRNNHCFQRIVLDNLFGQCWYTVLQRGKEAAYKQLTEAQLESAIALAEAIIARPDEYIYQLNQNSLRWRGKVR
ncbi:MAG: hypothetical protein KME15_28315 [Drouetiella hepatica Uher 2000/2452]|jgi:hypothetical protein|uniref:Uncharacterized protein n=1 Tax=Drouetiella hepatica Uher 2000/2452 TaxID=904376 RepID=A0A951QGE6_9CYAN|nr:hypothetical protein [Drouetiella hepatica Uher 2000/2452]